MWRFWYKRIENLEYPSGSQIPSETQLATEFNTSRTTIRAAVNRLAERNLVAKRHGIGTFVRHKPRLNNPLNRAEDLKELITRHGFVSDVQFISVNLIKADVEMLEIFGLQAGAEVLQTLKIFTADGKPIIFTKNSIPVSLLGEELASGSVGSPGNYRTTFRVS